MLSVCCKNKLDLANAKLSDEYYYQSLPLCVIDAVFSIGIKYTITRNVVINFCKKYNIPRLRKYGGGYPDKKQQLSIDDFLKIYKKHTINEITENFFKNKCRTSTKNGILKSEATKLFCEVLQKYNVNYFQDLHKIIGNGDFEQDIKEISGQKSGISTNYFYMLAGEDNFIKPDRMVLRFIDSCTGLSKLKIEEATELVKEAHAKLVVDFPSLTLRELDHSIWNYQRIS